MDDESHASTEYASNSTPFSRESPNYGGAIFSGSRHFAVSSGTFTSVTNNYISKPTALYDVPMISMGDIDLRYEIKLDHETGVVDRQRKQAYVRRIYSASVEGRKSSATVFMYQGNGAEEVRMASRYCHIYVCTASPKLSLVLIGSLTFESSHPNVIQICGAASSGEIHATIFHDDLIPFRHFMGPHRHSHFPTVYIYAYCSADFHVSEIEPAIHLFYIAAGVASLFSFCVPTGVGKLRKPRTLFTHELLQRYWECTILIRRSTGRLCAEFTPASESVYLEEDLDNISNMPREFPLVSLDAETNIIDSLTLEGYHTICSLYLPRGRNISVSTRLAVDLGGVVMGSSNEFEDPVGIGMLSDVKAYHNLWDYAIPGEVMEDGWTRFASDSASNGIFWLEVWATNAIYWLSQANHIFGRLQITSNLENYVLVRGAYFQLKISETVGSPRTGFLFLCPEEDFHVGPSSFRWPECPAYWSLDPCGVERLSTFEATQLGFPSIQLTATIDGWYWEDIVYGGLGQFHRAKGFDPDSQEVARHLRYPLFQLSNERDSQFLDAYAERRTEDVQRK
ncbi:hypothetical protein MVEN_02152900 [Mycena venus]|uniref:Uncharacterized protein n=1 Tax=Mycena venus TaxID=2733690 RepID=A0A8H7CGT4_9AGAR|nr:hypothetical protein MVEN_02152900 [Mycena venus]